LRNRQQAEYFSRHAFQKQEHIRAALEETQEQLAEKKRLLAQLVPQYTVGDIETRQTVSPLRTVIVDDEKAQRSALQRKLEDTFGRQIVVSGEAFSVDSAISIISDCQPDLLFLDIDLIGGTGFDVLDAFPNPHFAVIFVTSFPEFGARAFRYAAIDYILKPVDPIHLQEAVERVFMLRKLGRVSNIKFDLSVSPSTTKHNGAAQPKGEAEAEKLRLRVRSNGASETLLLPLHLILAVESRNNKVIVHMSDDTECEASGTLKSLEATLPAALFVRCHASYIINLNAVFSQSRWQLTLIGNRTIPISRKYKWQTHQKIATFLDQKILKNG
jgi:two-component system LytT family response regulator